MKTPVSRTVTSCWGSGSAASSVLKDLKDADSLPRKLGRCWGIDTGSGGAASSAPVPAASSAAVTGSFAAAAAAATATATAAAAAPPDEGAVTLECVNDRVGEQRGLTGSAFVKGSWRAGSEGPWITATTVDRWDDE